MKQRLKNLQWLVLLPAIVILWQGCRECRSDDVPVLQLRVQMQNDGMYILRSDLQEPQPFFNNETLQLPLALNADTTVYEIFSREGRMWQLALAYNRRAGFEDRRCGFFLDMVNPRVLPQTSFSNVQVEDNDIVWNVTVTE